MAVKGIHMGGNQISPPRWADALLRTLLSPEQAESESGDLLEAYRDSIFPLRGRWRADLWFLRQVVGYILRARCTRLCNWILAGLLLCVFTMLFTILMFPYLLSGRQWLLVSCAFGSIVLLYTYAAICWTRPVTQQDATVLRLGTRYGIAAGALWIGGYIALNLGMAVGWLLALFAFSLPIVAGAHGSIKLWRVRAGMQVGFWSGLISGLMVFLAGMALGYILAYVPGLPGAEIPANHAYTALEYEQSNVADTFGGALVHLFFFSGIFSVIGGTAGGFAGLLFVRTGEAPDTSRRILWGLLTFCIVGSAILSAGSRHSQSASSFEAASIQPGPPEIWKSFK